MAATKQVEAKEAATVSAVRSTAVPEWFDRWLGDWSFPRSWAQLQRALPGGPELLNVEEYTEGDELVVRAEMPGIDPDKDVDISVTDHTLRLRAERRETTTADAKDGYRSEFRYGSFLRSVQLPDRATEKDVKASYKDGILEVRIPVNAAAPEPAKIPIRRA